MGRTVRPLAVILGIYFVCISAVADSLLIGLYAAAIETVLLGALGAASEWYDRR